MDDNQNRDIPAADQPIPFKAETRQLLHILAHSLYTEREIFLRELISNASDALTRVNFEMLTNRDVMDPEAELAIYIDWNSDEGTLTISDTGIGMTAEELTANLGTIAHSGAKAFVEAASQSDKNLSDIIGQFGVGFYSAFMVADWIRVTSRSYLKDAQAAFWYSDGSDIFNVGPAEVESRGTKVLIKLNEDAKEFANKARLTEIIKRHSDFVAYPIYLGDAREQVNRQTAIWRQPPRQVEDKEYDEFYRQLTLDPDPPLAHAHLAVDAPVQMYALLYVPAGAERSIFSDRKQDGLKLYSHKILIQEYCQDLLPEYLNFVQGVVDSEDLPLNISRESVQANKSMVNLKRLVTNKVIDTLEELAEEESGDYAKFWEAFSRNIKQGVATETDNPAKLYGLLRFKSTTQQESWTSLKEYTERMVEGQEKIYYIMADDQRSALLSPHLDLVKRQGYEVLLMTDPLDPFMLVRMTEYLDYRLENVASADDEAEDEETTAEGEHDLTSETNFSSLIEKFKQVLGEKVVDVRMNSRLVDSPARLVDPQGSAQQELQRVYRLLNKDYEIPKKVLELNPKNSIINQINNQPGDSSLAPLVIEQIYEDALLIEGLHTDPAGMVERIQQLITAALEKG